MLLYILLFAGVGAAIGYIQASGVRSNAVAPKTAAILGGVGGLLGGILLRAIFPFMLGLIGAVIGALAVIWAYKRFGNPR